MRYFPFIYILFIFVSPALAQEKSAKKGTHVIDLFEGETGRVKKRNGPLIIESGEQSAFGGVSGEDGFKLKFQRGGNGIFVPALINGKKVYFLFDTGATTTTLNTEIAQKTRVLPERDAPVAVMSTANGNIRAPFGVIDNLKLGGRSHYNVSYSLCDNCPSGTFKGKPIAGLLGMNVIGRYRASIDDEKGVVELTPLKSGDNRIRDIRPFVEVVPQGGLQGKEEVMISVLIRNKGKTPIKKITVKLHCQDQKVGKKKIKNLKGRKEKRVTITVPSAGCGQPRIELVSAEWGR